MLFGKIVRKYWHVLKDLYLSNDTGGILFHEFSPFFAQLERSNSVGFFGEKICNMIFEGDQIP